MIYIYIWVIIYFFNVMNPAVLKKSTKKPSFSEFYTHLSVHRDSILTFRHRASSILGQAFRYSPENAFYIFNQQIYFII